MIPVPSRPLRRGRWVTVLPLLALVAACGAPTRAPASSPSSLPAPVVTTPATSPSPTPPALPHAYDDTDVSGYRPVCGEYAGGRRAYPGAAAYAGRGLHPIAFFGLGKISDWNSGLFISADDSRVDTWYAKDYRDLQLVACVRGAVGKKIRSCGTYLGGSRANTRAEMHWGEYTLDVYQARTAKPVVTGLHLRGRGKSKCPVILSGADVPDSGVAKLITDLTGAQVAQALGKYVE